MNTVATPREVAIAQARAAEEGRWLEAHVLLGWMARQEQGRPVYRCFRAGCGQLLPGDYVEAFCSADCADAYAAAADRRRAA